MTTREKVLTILQPENIHRHFSNKVRVSHITVGSVTEVEITREDKAGTYSLVLSVGDTKIQGSQRTIPKKCKAISVDQMVGHVSYDLLERIIKESETSLRRKYNLLPPMSLESLVLDTIPQFIGARRLT